MNPEIRCHVCGVHELARNANPHKQVVFCGNCAAIARYNLGCVWAGLDPDEKEGQILAMVEAEIPKPKIPDFFWFRQREEIDAILNQIK